MKKITDFIVNKRNIILILMLLFAGVSLVLSNKVKINYDITKYLPSSSETRMGMDIMEEEFSENSSLLSVMLKDLDEDEKLVVQQYLEEVDGVSKVEYDDSDSYNKDGYTLYQLTIDDSADSSLASQVYRNIKEHFEDYELYTSGEVSEENKPVLQMWIIVVAVLCALVILIIMCESYLEPFLFLATILVGVLLNKGTNIIFPNISNITNSISAILQMALSMDYSIMLMNRYRQERDVDSNKISAMKKALFKAFCSISSSSVTTIVGLLALVFMSFTIGRDLGFVLAKGVLLSLVCIFTCLPGLILIFDSLIERTKKKSPVIRLDKLGKLAYNIRYFSIILFVLAFVGSYFLKGNLKILYTDSENDEVAKHFKENNQIAVVYSNKNEKEISKFCKKIEKDDRVGQVLCYGNTINEPLKYDEVNPKLKDLGADVDIDLFLLRILYYHYFLPEENNKITFKELVSFVENDVYSNSKISGQLDSNIRDNITTLKYFSDSSQLNEERDISFIASLLGIDYDKVQDLLVYYYSKNNTTKMNISTFVKFIKSDVLTNEKYASSIDSNARSMLDEVEKFTDKNLILKQVTYQDMANLFGMRNEDISLLYTYYASCNDSNTKLSISSFVEFLNQYILTNPEYSYLIDADGRKNIQLLGTFSREDLITSSMNSSLLAQTFGLDENIVNGVFLLKYGSQDNGGKLTIGEFVNGVILLKNHTHYLDSVDTTSLEALSQNSVVMANPTQYTATEISQVLGISVDECYQLYALISLFNHQTDSWMMSPYEFVCFILENQTNENISSQLNGDVVNQLMRVQGIMSSTLKHNVYSYQDMAAFLGMDVNLIKSIYGLYDSSIVDVAISPYEFVNFLINHKDDPLLKSHLSREVLGSIFNLQKVMNGVVYNKSYSALELSNIFSIYSSQLQLLYSLYDVSNQKNSTISLRDFVQFLIQDVVSNPTFSGNFDEDARLKINTIYEIMNSSLSSISYNKEEMYKLLGALSDDISKDIIDILYIYYGSIKEYDDSSVLTVEKLVSYLNRELLKDERFSNFIDNNMREKVIDADSMISDAKKMLVGKDYSRVVINTTLKTEEKEVFDLIKKIKDSFKDSSSDTYVIGNSPMALEMSDTFQGELDFITILTMLFIFVVVAFTFKSLIIPTVLVLLIQCAVYLTMGFLSLNGGSVYFISLLIVQSILMGATIDYAIVYTSYYLESRESMNVKNAVINSYNKSIHTILTSASILIIVTLIVGQFASAIAAKICKTLSQGTLCSTLLILLLLPAILCCCDRFIVRKK